MAKATKTDNEFTPLNLYTQNWNKWKDVYIVILSLLQENSDIPIEIIREFFRLTIHEPFVNSAIILKKAEDITQNTTNYFLENKEYEFSGKRKRTAADSNLTSNFIEYSFEDFIRKCVLFCLYEEKNNKGRYNNKDETIRLFYRTLHLLSHLMFNQAHQKTFTHYKRAVIAVYLTKELGFKVTTIKNPKNEDLFHASKSALKNFNK